MARKQDAGKPSQEFIRYPLLVYYNLGRRYRPPGLLLIFLGLFMFLPSFISELKNELVDPDALAAAGGVLVIIGLAFLMFARLMIRRAYVQCAPEVLVVQAPFFQTLISYRRIKQVQPVQVSQVFPKDSLKGMAKPLLRPLLPATAVEVYVKSWPGSRKRLQRFLGKYLFSPRADAWIFIVPNYSGLLRQIDVAMQRKAEADRAQAAESYQDPFTRLQAYKK